MNELETRFFLIKNTSKSGLVMPDINKAKIDCKITRIIHPINDGYPLGTKTGIPNKANGRRGAKAVQKIVKPRMS